MIKQAFTAHKLRNLSAEAMDVLRKAGVINPDKVTRGLERGSQALAKKYGINIRRYAKKDNKSILNSWTTNGVSSDNTNFSPYGATINLGRTTDLLKHNDEFMRLPFKEKLSIARGMRAQVKRHEVDEAIILPRDASPDVAELFGHGNIGVVAKEGYNSKYLPHMSTEPVYAYRAGVNGIKSNRHSSRMTAQDMVHEARLLHRAKAKTKYTNSNLDPRFLNITDPSKRMGYLFRHLPNENVYLKKGFNFTYGSHPNKGDIK